MEGDRTGEGERHREGGAPPGSPPAPVRVPVNVHDWTRITFLHWPVDPAALTRLVPDDLVVLTFEGAAWVGVTPFVIRVRPPGMPAVPRLAVFPETNVRTYVAGPDGREGLWFLHMEVTRSWFVATLRALGLPYFRHRMAVDAGDDRVSYVSRLPASGMLSHHVAVRPGQRLSTSPGGPKERFLTARWGAYHRARRRLLYTRVDHPPWPLHDAELVACHVDPILRRAGLPAPAGPPLVHYSPGVTVKVGRPETVG